MRQVAAPISDERLLDVHQILVTMATTRRCDFTSIDICDAANLIVELFERRRRASGARQGSQAADAPAAGIR